MTTAGTAVLKHPGIRAIWSASAFTAVASWSVQIAVTVQVLSDRSVSVLAVVQLAGTLPMLLLLPFAGVWADRFDVRRISLAAMTVQAACSTALGLVIHGNPVTIAAVYALQGALNAFWPPARQQWLYGMVTDEMRVRANAAIGSVNGLMTLVGAGLGGALSGWDPDVAVFTGAGFQALAALRLVRTSRPEPVRHDETQRTAHRMLTDIADGIRTVRWYPLAGSVVWIGIAWGLISGGYSVLLSGHVTGDLHGGSVVLGLVFAIDGLSVIAATAFAGRVPRARHLAVYGASYVVQGLAWALMFATSLFPLTVAALVVMRLASGFIIALDNTILLATVPPRLRGRVSSLHMTTYNAVDRASLGLLGVVLTAFTVQSVGQVAGLASAVFGLVWWRFSRTARQRYLAGDNTTDSTDKPKEMT
ncbi:MFS transporter [Streptomyces sp. NPDC058469]|uniref:MFS transporter n=1 Tax=Streptomyces sp. NPDC058469 TaxID=3346514 RepID=UPI0036640B20